jgi:Zn-dependent peptidase ImmA (M78 family)
MWKLPPGPVRNLVRLIEDLGCLVVPIDFGSRKIDGCSLFIDAVPVIFVNASISAARQRITIAHELGHLLMHRFPSEEAEEEAFLFATELLVPADEIRSMLRPISMDRLARLKLHWGISMQALLKRAEQLGLIQGSTVRYHWSQMALAGYRDQEPYDDQMQAEMPTLVAEILKTYLNELQYTEEELATHLLMLPSEFRSEYVAAGAGFKVLK